MVRLLPQALLVLMLVAVPAARAEQPMDLDGFSVSEFPQAASSTGLRVACRRIGEAAGEGRFPVCAWWSYGLKW